MERTLNDVLRIITLQYLDTVNPASPPPPQTIEADILRNVQTSFELENTTRPAGNKWKIPQKLDPSQIAMIVAKLYPVCTVCTGGEGSDRSYDLLAMYCAEGSNRGIYVTDDEIFRETMQQYNFTMRTYEFTEAMALLRSLVPRKHRCRQTNLIAVNNGIFDYDTKTLKDFDPDLVFLTKSHIDYHPSVINPIIHNDDDGTDWDVESWMNELSDDPEVVNLLWEILGAIIRPLVSWSKSAWFYSETGNNGKGTLCELMRQLCGEGSYTSIPLADMGKDFMLEPLTRASAIIVDENDVGTFIDKAANLKAIITNDVIQINRKFKTPIPYKFYGFMIQCLNEFPKVKDKSDSFFRRQLFIPFEKCFTGKERRYIKYDYMHRPEVLEYVLHRVLHMNYMELSEPQACRLALEEYKEYNDPVRQFLEDVLPVVQWDLLPFTLLYGMYQNWFKLNMPSGKLQSRNTFINDVVNAIKAYDDWACPDRKQQTTGYGKMSVCEPLLMQYNMVDWMNPKFAHMGAATMEQKCTPMAGQYDKDRYRGIRRVKPQTQTNDSNVDGEDNEENSTAAEERTDNE